MHIKEYILNIRTGKCYREGISPDGGNNNGNGNNWWINDRSGASYVTVIIISLLIVGFVALTTFVLLHLKKAMAERHRPVSH